MTTVAKNLSNVEVLDLDGQPVQLGTVWKDQTTVLVFIRHYGWLFCREQVTQLRDTWPELEKRGARLVVVGNGQPYHAQDFQTEQQLPFTLLTDPDLKAYAAAGLRRGALSVLHPRVLGNAVRSLRSGFRQGRTQGDPWQQGGVFVITPDDKVLFNHTSREAGDHPEPSKILDALPRPSWPPQLFPSQHHQGTKAGAKASPMDTAPMVAVTTLME